MKIMYNGKEISNTLRTYKDIPGKPKINSAELIGNLTSNELNMYTKKEVNKLITSMRNIVVLPEMPDNPAANTIYYIGDGSAPYNVYATDTEKNVISLGTTDIDFSEYQKITDSTLETASKNVPGAINELNELLGDEVLTTTATTATGAINELNEKCATFIGAADDSNGKEGIVPAPLQGDTKKYLKADGTWAIPMVEGKNIPEKNGTDLLTTGGLFESIACKILGKGSATLKLSTNASVDYNDVVETVNALTANGFRPTGEVVNGRAIYKRVMDGVTVDTVGAGNAKPVIPIDMLYTNPTLENFPKPIVSETTMWVGNDFSIAKDGATTLEFIYCYRYSNNGTDFYLYTTANTFTTVDPNIKDSKTKVYCETSQTTWVAAQPYLCIRNSGTVTANNVVFSGSLYVAVPALYEATEIKMPPERKFAARDVKVEISNGSLYIHD